MLIKATPAIGLLQPGRNRPGIMFIRAASLPEVAPLVQGRVGIERKLTFAWCGYLIVSGEGITVGDEGTGGFPEFLHSREPVAGPD